MHHIYHTQGLILGSRNFGETGKYYYIFTRDLGMIYASASGVRKLSSKLRFVLQDFAYVNVDLVEGKDFWRVTSASKTNQLEKIIRRPKIFAVVSNVALLLRRLLAGVEPNKILFADLVSGLTILEKLTLDEDIQNTEAVIVLRVLNNLGYIGGHTLLKDLIRSPLEEDLIFRVSGKRRDVLYHINQALKETHL